MPLIDMRDMLNHAYRNHYAVGGFGTDSLDVLRAVLAAAERCRSPVVVNVDGARLDDDALEPLVAAAECAAQRASVPVALHFERGRSLEAAARAVNAGCNGVMVRVAPESFPGMVADVRRVAEMAHGCGVTVEGELGDAEADGAEVPGVSVEEARAFVQRTGVDCLALPVCRSNGRTRGRAKPDADRLRRITEAVQVPLVIQAGNGLADEHYYRLIQHGVAKINCDRALTEGTGESVGAQVERCMQLWGSAGRAAEVLVQCRAWQPVQHVIVYNVEGADDAQVAAMMARGREVLGRIPGVRRVFTGWALQKSAKFRCCWLVEFAHEKVVDSYRDHPDHVAFANQLFRPIAGDRISIDFAGAVRPLEAGAANNGAYAAGPVAVASGR
jgi:fructose-bisphosphate aldolase, class II